MSETDFGPAAIEPEWMPRPASERLAAMAEAAGVTVEHRLFDDGETYYLTSRAEGVYIRVSRNWGDSPTAAEAALADLTTALEHRTVTYPPNAPEDTALAPDERGHLATPDELSGRVSKS